MLFSNDQVAQFINGNFEATWEMVREVPIVRIDFGSGNVLTRTLHGNILTSVCTADGKTLDALPGIYHPASYLDQLDQFRLLAQNVQTEQQEVVRQHWIRRYHLRQAERIAKNQPVERFNIEVKKVVPVLPFTKAKIERSAEQFLAGPPSGTFPGRPPNGVPPPRKPNPNLVNPAEELAGWKELIEDTQLNETTRRRQIHELLAKEGLLGIPTPNQVLKPIYKDVLHADLDDPYLGLGKVLFENYPFAQEDAKR